MTIFIKSKSEIKNMRIVGRLAAEVLEFIEPYVVPGISTGELDKICHSYIVKKQQAIPACLNYYGFPKSICTSINDVICHGIPDDKTFIKNGDIINIDVAVVKDGFYGDVSKMFIVGKTTDQGEKLCKITQESLYCAMRIVKSGIRLKKIGQVIQNLVEKNNFSIVREYCGHGIGKSFHEEPQVLHYESEDNGIILKKGMIFTIEPMVNAGKRNIRKMQDGWTIKTKDRKLSAQYEHTILVTDLGCEILTLRKEEPFSSPVLINV